MAQHKRQLVRLWKRPSKDGQSLIYYLRYVDLDGKRRCISLDHADARKAEKQRITKERELRMGFCPPDSMKLSEFAKDYFRRTGDQLAPSTQTEYNQSMKHFIRIVGDIDFRAVTHQHGEKFRQACLDEGNKPHTVRKKLRELKAIFKSAVDRSQLDEHPLAKVKPPKVPKNNEIHTFSDEECDRLLREASRFQNEDLLEWDITITLALISGMRKSEILNLIWSDIDFAKMTITLTPKINTEQTWEWRIKDTDKRTLPLTEDVVRLLTALYDRRPEGYPYVMVPPHRYDRIQVLRKQGRWKYTSSRTTIENNFTRHFKQIKTLAGISSGTFHDLRRTAITNWFYQGLSIIEVMRLAGHSKYETTLRYYLHVKDDLVDRARQAIRHKVSKEMLDRCLGGQNDRPKPNSVQP